MLTSCPAVMAICLNYFQGGKFFLVISMSHNCRQLGKYVERQFQGLLQDNVAPRNQLSLFSSSMSIYFSLQAAFKGSMTYEIAHPKEPSNYTPL